MQSPLKGILAVLTFSTLLLAGQILSSRKTQTLEKPITYWDAIAPYSADPLDYDVWIHHMAFRAVLAPLVTQYRIGEHVGVIAESWRSSPDHKEWHFKIRKDLSFENGDEITPEVVRKSLARIGVLLKKRGSKSELFDSLIDHEKLISLSSKIRGLEVFGDFLTFRFNSPFPKLLETLSFGTLSISSPKNYDELSGKWKDSKSVLASGAYRVAEWNDSKFRLVLRDEFPAKLRHPRPLREITFIQNPNSVELADIVGGDSTSTHLSPKFIFYGGALSQIAYAHCVSWQEKGSPCHNIKERRIIRNAFYQAMESRGSKIIRSFFPTVMNGIKEADAPGVENIIRNEAHDNNPKKLRFRLASRKNPIRGNFNLAISDAAKSVGMIPEGKEIPVPDLVADLDPARKTHNADIYYMETGILIDDPDSDIKFMFLSKEGVRLPDVNGGILRTISTSQFDPQKINDLLWDQAVIWPITHFRTGLWAKDSLDFSHLNLVLPATDFSWIGWK